MVRSLQKLCEVGLAVDICNDYEIKEIIFSISDEEDFSSENGRYSEEVECWHSNMLKTFSKIAAHFPPWLLAGGTKNYFPLIGIEMLKWTKFHKETFRLPIDFCKGLVSNSIFKTNGSIDREKAARALVEETSLSLLCRMEIACYYSFPDKITELWILLKESGIKSIPSNGSNLYFRDMVKSWTCNLFDINKSLVGTKNFIYNTLIITVNCASDVSFRYFWKQSGDKEKELVAYSFMDVFLQKLKTIENIDECLKLQYLYESYINMFQIIVEELNDERVLDLLHKFYFPHEIFVYSLHWHYQSLFLKLCLLLESATGEETDYLLDICWDTILVKSLEKGLSRFADVFLKCCKVEDKDFKIDFLSSFKFDATLENLFYNYNYSTIDKVFKWILGSKGLAVIKFKILLAISGNLNFMHENYVLSIKSEDNDLDSDLRYNFDTIVQILHYFLIYKMDDKINEYVEWICHSKEKINIYRDAIYKNYSNKNHQYGDCSLKLRTRIKRRWNKLYLLR